MHDKTRSFIGFIPTHPDHIETFCELADLSPDDVVYDLGSGDGRLVFAALRAGAGKAVGIELDGSLVEIARSTATKKRLTGRAQFVHADIARVDLSQASVVFCYLTPQASEELGPKFERELRTGTRIIMESFPIPGWVPHKTAARGYVDYYETNRFYLYVMPHLSK